MNENDRRMRAKVAIHTRWAMEADRTQATARAREGFLQRFVDQVDPAGVLTPDERAKRAASARKAYFQALALKSARARRRGAA